MLMKIKTIIMRMLAKPRVKKVDVKNIKASTDYLRSKLGVCKNSIERYRSMSADAMAERKLNLDGAEDKLHEAFKVGVEARRNFLELKRDLTLHRMQVLGSDFNEKKLAALLHLHEWDFVKRNAMLAFDSESTYKAVCEFSNDLIEMNLIAIQELAYLDFKINPSTPFVKLGQHNGIALEV